MTSPVTEHWYDRLQPHETTYLPSQAGPLGTSTQHRCPFGRTAPATATADPTQPLVQTHRLLSYDAPHRKPQTAPMHIQAATTTQLSPACWERTTLHAQPKPRNVVSRLHVRGTASQADAYNLHGCCNGYPAWWRLAQKPTWSQISFFHADLGSHKHPQIGRFGRGPLDILFLGAGQHAGRAGFQMLLMQGSTTVFM